MGEPEQEHMTYTEPSLWPTGTAPAPSICGEDERLVTLASYSASDLRGDDELGRIARFAAQLCDAPSAAVSLVEAERQIFIAREGLEASETPRATSLCAYTMMQGTVMEVPDAAGDPRFADFALVRGEAHLRFYAGAPLISAEGAPLGALCVIDSAPRPGGLTDLQREGLLVLADAVKRRLLAHREVNRALQELRDSSARLRFMFDSVPDIAWSAAPGPQFDSFNARWQIVTGMAAPHTIEDWRGVIHPDDYEATVANFQTALQNADLFEDEWRIRHADGTYRWVLSRAMPSTNDPATAWWFGTITDIDDAYRASQERELVTGELAHRIKNIFSVIISLISLHARGNAVTEAFAEMLSETIRALSRAQEFALRIDPAKAGDLKGLLGVLMAPYGTPGASAVSITGNAVAFGPRAATPLALVFHELATNSAKYGALSTASGTLAIHVERRGDDAVISWHEAGGPATRQPEGKGFGSRLMTMAVQHQLGGQMEMDWQPGGLRTSIALPLARLGN